MKSIFVISFIVFSYSALSQKKNCFDLARYGTLSEIISEYSKNNKIIDSVDANSSSMLILACYKNNNEVAKFIVDKKANLDYISSNGTALMACVIKGNIEMAEFLLLNKANPNLTDINGITALMYAAQFQNEKMIKLLLDHKANKNIKDKQGKTAFEYAVMTKNELIINQFK